MNAPLSSAVLSEKDAAAPAPRYAEAQLSWERTVAFFKKNLA